MLQAIKRFFSYSKALDKQAEEIYAELVEKARQPILYQEGGVVDSVEGRTEMLYLHLFIESRRQDSHVFQAILKQFFSHMDANLREMGVGDLTVPKKIKAIGSSYLGRIRVYSDSFDNHEALQDSFKRNIPFKNDCAAGSEPNQCVSYLVKYTLSALAKTE